MAAVSSPSRPSPRPAHGPGDRSPWLDVDWRAHQHWTVIDNSPVNVVELGEGPPVLFVHGLIGSWPNWLEQLPVLARTHRVIAVDLPGSNHSPAPTGNVSISGYARTLDALLDTLELDAAAIVGHSMGGFAAAELALEHPRRVERLVLVAPAGLSTYHDPRDPRAMRELRRIHRVQRPFAATVAWGAAHADALARRPGLRKIALRSLVHRPDRLPAPLAAELIRGADMAAFVPALHAILDYDFRHRLPEIACPTLIVWGAEDRVVTVRDADAYAELIPGSRSVVLPDTGHLPQVERPAELNALLAEFLSQ